MTMCMPIVWRYIVFLMFQKSVQSGESESFMTKYIHVSYLWDADHLISQQL